MTTQNIESIIHLFQPISLEEMDSIRLMNRIDTKYLTDISTLESVLKDAFDSGYRAFETDGLKIAPYDSLYYDTPVMGMFQAHHDCRATRQKIRTRTYLSSGLTFLEVKKKDNHGRTRKKRVEIPQNCFSDIRKNDAACTWLDSHSVYHVDEVSPSVQTTFSRITLVNPTKTERLTIDMDVRFANHRTGVSASMGSAVIIELKQDGRAVSRMKEILLANRVKPFKISKYCVGVTMTNPEARSNRFRQKVRIINKINSKFD